jgi:WS/DGAT/MGAT family acyltransferase
MTPLGAIDALWLHLETADTPMHVGALHLLDAPAGGGDFHDAVRRHLDARLASSPVFTRRLRTLPLGVANPLWTEGRVDLTYHLKRVRLPAPGTLRQLEQTVARLHAQRLDRRRPLWQFFLIDGLADGGYALYSKLHHAAIDGAAGVVLAQALLDADPGAAARPGTDRPPGRPTDAAPGRPTDAAPGTARLLAAALADSGRAGLGLLRQAPSLAGAALGALRGAGRGVLADWARQFGLAPQTLFNRAIDARRSIATARLPLAPLQAIAAAQEATVNDVVLAVVGGALRGYLAERGALPDKSLLAAMPVSLRAHGDRQMNTQATMAQASLGTDIADPLERLRAVHVAAGAAKAMSRGLRPAFGLALPSLGLPWLIGAAATLWAGGLAERLPRLANVVVSNVPGPSIPLYIAGARLRTWWPLSIVEHGLGLNVTVMRYVDSLDVGLVAATRLVPDAAPLAQALGAAFDELAARALPPPRSRRRRVAGCAAGAKAAAVAAKKAGTPVRRRKAG